ncbi:hypothetical protein N9097_00635 [bacterium]|nr:hypothetical protein [Akkermansiaceae bacterium]MDB4585070.1 hypothetical protein [bacterium]MDA7863846.1 hypothetical protein [Akkermansiaceae bacterium]MDB4143602.1 hypothetical protein [Akkermansiaceae bacterium]MDB4265805.1 hypothetical protein [Akkermansiaceae bacterium]
MKQVLGILVGLLIGVVGGVMFSKSIAPEMGSAEDRLEQSERELRKAEGEIRALVASGARNEKRKVGDGVRDMMWRIRNGEDVSLDDVLVTMKPWMREMTPLFERIRKVNEDEWADTMAGRWGSDYDLSDADQDVLREWFKQRSRERAGLFTDVVESDESGFVDFVQATEYDWRDANGAEKVMEGILEGEQLEKFKLERLTERHESVEGEAHRNLTRLDNIVALDSDQHFKLFGVMARGSEDYQEGMEFDGMDSGIGQLDRDGRNAAIESVLRPDQREVLETHRAEREAEAQREMSKIGLSLPKDWDLLEGDRF